MDSAVEKICSIGLLPCVVINNPERAEPLGQALVNAGIPAVEILLRTEHALESMRVMKKSHPELAVGAGTVLTPEQAETAKKMGADFIVSPGYSRSVVDWCREEKLPIIPGCTSASEIQNAYASGLRTVKFFPSEQLGGLKTIKQLSSVFAGVKFLPTGGINMDNIGAYLQEECIAACGGTFMTPTPDVENGCFEKIESLCRSAIESSLGFRLAHVGVNAEGDRDAAGIAAAFCSLFMLPVIDKGGSVFAGPVVECMKRNGRGEKGHIGIRTNSVDRAVAWLKAKGIAFAPETAGRNASGSLEYI